MKYCCAALVMQSTKAKSKPQIAWKENLNHWCCWARSQLWTHSAKYLSCLHSYDLLLCWLCFFGMGRQYVYLVWFHCIYDIADFVYPFLGAKSREHSVLICVLFCDSCYPSVDCYMSITNKKSIYIHLYGSCYSLFVSLSHLLCWFPKQTDTSNRISWQVP